MTDYLLRRSLQPVPQCNMVHYGHRSFSQAGPFLCNVYRRNCSWSHQWMFSKQVSKCTICDEYPCALRFIIQNLLLTSGYFLNYLLYYSPSLCSCTESLCKHYRTVLLWVVWRPAFDPLDLKLAKPAPKYYSPIPEVFSGGYFW